MNVAVLGAGGFVGGHLVNRLVYEGHEVRAVDIKPIDEWHQRNGKTWAHELDCSDPMRAYEAVEAVEQVYLLAADMGGIGFIEQSRMACALNVLITANVLKAAAQAKVDRLFYSSSACVYPAGLQSDIRFMGPDGLREDDAYPAEPEDGYGWEKLYGERLCRHFDEETGLTCRVARYHNIYGPHGTWMGGREKAPAALCRKVAEVDAGLSDYVEIWGDGSQYRSYCYIDDCVEGTLRLMLSEHGPDPINIGSSEGVNVNDLVGVIREVAGIDELDIRYDTTAPQGVAGRNSDNALCRETLGWEPRISLENGIAELYPWVLMQVAEHAGMTH